MNPEHILFAIASLWALALGCGALARKPRTLTVLSFAIGMALLAGDAFVALLISRAAEVQEVLRLERIRLVIISALPAAWLAFSLSYSRGNSQRFLAGWKPVLIAACFFPLLPAVAYNHLYTLDQNVWDLGGTPILELTWLTRAIHCTVLVFAVLVLMNLERTLRAAVGTMRWRIKFAILGLGLIFAARVYTSSQRLLYSVSDPGLVVFNAGALLLGCLLLTISFLRSSISGVEVYPSLAVLEKSLTVILAGAYFLVVGVLARFIAFLGGDAAFPLKALLVLVAVMALGILLASDRARLLFKRFLSRHFHRPFYDYRGLWRSFTERTSSIVDEKAYARVLANLISDAVQTLSVSVWIKQPGTAEMGLAASTALPQGEEAMSTTHGIAEARMSHQNLPLPSPIASRLAKDPEPFALDDTKEEWVEELKRRNPGQFRKGGKRICVPLAGKGELLGMLIIGDRVNGVPLSVEDFELFKCLAAQAAGGLLNLQLTQRLLQNKEMEAFQTMSAFFVHDLKNTASTVSLTLQNLPAHFDDPVFRQDALRAISKSLGRINDLIGRLTVLREKLELHPVEKDLNEVVSEALNGMEEALVGNLVRNFRPVPPILLDPEQIHKVVVNLLLNARDAAGKSGEIQIETGQRNGWAMLSVSDNGCGMSQEFIRQSLFRPFHTTKKKGVGIGMFHTRMIVDAHQGRIEVESQERKGTIFRVLLPLAGETNPKQAAPTDS